MSTPITLWEVVKNDCFELPIGVYSSKGEAEAHRPKIKIKGKPMYKIVKVMYRSKKDYENCGK